MNGTLKGFVVLLFIGIVIATPHSAHGCRWDRDTINDETDFMNKRELDLRAAVLDIVIG